MLESSKGITSLTCDQSFNVCKEGANPATGPVRYDGPLNSAIVIRRNKLSHGQGVTLHGTTSDAVVEWNWVHLGTGTFMKAPVVVDPTHTDHLLIANNKQDA